MLNYSRKGDLMNEITIRSILAMLSVFPAALAIFLMQPSAVPAQEQKERVIELSAKKYEYSSSPLHVRQAPRFSSKSTPRTTIMVSNFRLFPMALHPMAHPG